MPTVRFSPSLRSFPARGRSLVGLDRALRHRRRSAAYGALYAVANHEIEAASVGTDYRLPALDWAVDRTGTSVSSFSV